MSDIFPKGSAWMNGEFIQLSEAKIPILDWGFLRSDATYDVVHVWKLSAPINSFCFTIVFKHIFLM
ncbi:hypothetical protein OAS99_00875 [Candidatus Pelagibacter sp.]|nr:hypothetical protein [Candidatus Pelagibacter sp.]